MFADVLQRAIGFAIVGFALGACGNQVPATITYARYQFTCCAASDVNRTWQPGETLTLHWIAKESARTADRVPHQVQLKARLSGAYADVASLKAGAGAVHDLRATTIMIDDRTSAAPVSTIALPSDLTPGLYNLVIEIDFGGGNRMSSATVVRVGF